MANPVITACPVNVWTKVATNVTSGQIHIKDTRPGVYLHTYRTSGEAAPTLQTEGVAIPGPSIPIQATAGIDIYIWPTGVAGSVRVDAP